MAQGLRARHLVLSLSLALLALCCGGDERQSAERPDLAPAELVDAVLEQSHGTLRGGMDRVFLELREGDEAADEIFLWLPDRMLVKSAEATDLLIAGEAWRRSGDNPSLELDGEDVASLIELRDLLRGLLLMPLYEMRSAKRDGSGLSLEVEGDERWHLELKDGSMLPAVLRGPAGEIRFLDSLDRSHTQLPTRVGLGSVGERQVRFRSTDVNLFFRLYASSSQPLPKQCSTPSSSAVLR